MFHGSLCYAILSVHCGLERLLEWAGLLGLLCVVFSCVFAAFPCVVLCRVWCLVVSIPDLCLLLYLNIKLVKFCGQVKTLINVSLQIRALGSSSLFS